VYYLKTMDAGTRVDEERMSELSQGKAEAMQPLFSRYAALVFHIAAQSLGTAAAEDIVQDVFLSVWRKADTFDPRRGTFRSWLLQVAHYRILNELRSRSRRPAVAPDSGPDVLEEIPAVDGEPAEEAWRAYRKEAVRAAVGRLPPAQRQALSLAFFEELTHDQVAATLNLPLGTVKTRIRTGVRKLRFLLAPLGVAAVALALLAGFGVRWSAQRALAERSDRALSLVTASDITTIRVTAAPGAPPDTHAAYRGRPGTPLAVMALHFFPPAPEGKTWQAWVLNGGAWTSMGTATVGADGYAVIVGEGDAYRELPDAIQVTAEPRGGSRQPTGQPEISWQRGK
jgi:RNA polymerase sigma-70 factor, ECF subfamily